MDSREHRLGAGDVARDVAHPPDDPLCGIDLPISPNAGVEGETDFGIGGGGGGALGRRHAAGGPNELRPGDCFDVLRHSRQLDRLVRDRDGPIGCRPEGS